MTGRRETEDPTDDDRPPICPACGVTQGMVVTEDEPRFVCLECGFSDGEAAD
jgi:ribosomal protein S27AE